MLDANVVITKCVQAVYEAADRYHPVLIGVIAGRVLPLSDGSQVVKIKVNIQYRNGQEKFAPLDCNIDNVGNISLKEHRE